MHSTECMMLQRCKSTDVKFARIKTAYDKKGAQPKVYPCFLANYLLYFSLFTLSVPSSLYQRCPGRRKCWMSLMDYSTVGAVTVTIYSRFNCCPRLFHLDTSIELNRITTTQPLSAHIRQIVRSTTTQAPGGLWTSTFIRR